MIRAAQDEALAFAAVLDRTLAAGPEDAIHDALVFGVGEICGGLGEGGFVADLRKFLDEDEGVLVGWNLSRRPEDKARWWLQRAREEMARAAQIREAA